MTICCLGLRMGVLWELKKHSIECNWMFYGLLYVKKILDGCLIHKVCESKIYFLVKDLI